MPSPQRKTERPPEGGAPWPALTSSVQIQPQDRGGDARRRAGLRLRRGGRPPLPRQQRQDDQGRPTDRRGPPPVAGVAARRHPRPAGPRRGRRRQLLGAEAQVQGGPPRRRSELQDRELRGLQREVRVPGGIGGGDRRPGAAQGGGRGPLHAGEPGAQPARPAGDRRGGGDHRRRRHRARPRHRRSHHRPVQGRAGIDGVLKNSVESSCSVSYF